MDCGNYFHGKGRIEKAIEYYEKALKVDPDDYYANTDLAGVLAANESFGESLSFFKKAISIKEPDLLALILTYVASNALGETGFAEGVLKKLLTLSGNDAAVYERISYTYFELGMFNEAECYIKKVLDAYPYNPASHFNPGNILLAKGDLRNSRCEFQKVLELAPRDKDRKFISFPKKEI